MFSVDSADSFVDFLERRSSKLVRRIAFFHQRRYQRRRVLWYRGPFVDLFRCSLDAGHNELDHACLTFGSQTLRRTMSKGSSAYGSDREYSSYNMMPNEYTSDSVEFFPSPRSKTGSCGRLQKVSLAVIRTKLHLPSNMESQSHPESPSPRAQNLRLSL